MPGRNESALILSILLASEEKLFLGANKANRLILAFEVVLFLVILVYKVLYITTTLFFITKPPSLNIFKIVVLQFHWF